MASAKIECQAVTRAVRWLTLLLLTLGSADASARSPKQTPTPRPSPTATPNATGSLSVVITDPLPGALVDSDRTGVRGTFAGPANTGVTVNDVIAYSRDGRFALNDLPLAAGANEITANATAADGRSGTASLTVDASGKPRPLELQADVSTGAAPLTVTFTYAFTAVGVVVNKLAMDFDGDGHDDFRTNRPPTSLVNTYSVPGLYFPKLKITDSVGHVHTAELAVEINSLDERDALFIAVWNGMNDALLRGDLNEALVHLNTRARRQYARVLQGLLPDIPAIVGSYAPPLRVSVTADVLEYAVNRMVDGEDRAFLVYLLRDADGVWRLDRM
jgi:Glucodextranase, domain B